MSFLLIEKQEHHNEEKFVGVASKNFILRSTVRPGTQQEQKSMP